MPGMNVTVGLGGGGWENNVQYRCYRDERHSFVCVPKAAQLCAKLAISCNFGVAKEDPSDLLRAIAKFKGDAQTHEVRRKALLPLQCKPPTPKKLFRKNTISYGNYFSIHTHLHLKMFTKKHTNSRTVTLVGFPNLRDALGGGRISSLPRLTIYNVNPINGKTSISGSKLGCFTRQNWQHEMESGNTQLACVKPLNECISNHCF